MEFDLDLMGQFIPVLGESTSEGGVVDGTEQVVDGTEDVVDGS